MADFLSSIRPDGTRTPDSSDSPQVTHPIRGLREKSSRGPTRRGQMLLRLLRIVNSGEVPTGQGGQHLSLAPKDATQNIIRAASQAVLQPIGATGFEPATFRPPAGTKPPSMHSMASHASLLSPSMDAGDTRDTSVGTTAVPPRTNYAFRFVGRPGPAVTLTNIVGARFVCQGDARILERAAA